MQGSAALASTLFDRASPLAVAMAAMNSLFYLAVDLLPLGVVATLFYLGPFVLAARHTPHGPELLLPLVALAGVYLATGAGPLGAVNVSGLVFGLAAAAALAAYTLASQRLGRAQGLDSVTLAVAGTMPADPDDVTSAAVAPTMR